MSNVHSIKRKSRRAPAAAVDFLHDADRIEQRRLPTLARSVLYVIVLTILALVAWASVSTIDSYVTANGKIITEGSHVVLQPLETSIVRDVKVRKGQAIRKGETLVEFDPTFTTSDLDRLTGELTVLTTKLARLESEHRDEIYSPANSTAQQSLERSLAERNRAERLAKRRELEAQIASLDSTIERLKSEVIQLAKQLRVMRRLEEMKTELVKKGAGSMSALLKEHMSTLNIEKQLSTTRQRILETQQEKQRTARMIESYDAQWRREVLQELIEVRANRDDVAEQVKKATHRTASASIRAPFDGYVLNVADRDTGSVVTSAEAIVTLVPIAANLLAEIWIPARDIGKISVGDSVRVKVESFPYQRHGIVEGKIESLSGDSFVGPDGQSGGNKAVPPGEIYYLARVSIPPIGDALHGLPKNFHALPGMTLNAEVQVGTRRVISYFLYPVFRMLDESIHES